MAICPNCKQEVSKLGKSWKFGQFTVNAYSCENCGIHFREYFKDGKHSFTLKRTRKRAGGRFTKVHFRE